MNAARIIFNIEATGARLISLCGGLKLVAAPGTITADMMTGIKDHRAEIIDIVNRRIEGDDQLAPCMLCAGHEFVETIGGGFYCATCHPDRPVEEIKRRVNGQQAAYATGYGCAKCGSNNYAGVVDAWLCMSCGKVFEWIGGSRGPSIVQAGFMPKNDKVQ